MLRKQLSTSIALVLLAGFSQSLSAQSQSVHLSLRLPERSLELRQQPLSEGGEITHVDIVGLEPKLWQSKPGLPNIPYTHRYLALPLGAKITGIEVKPGPAITQRGVSLLGWTQPEQPSANRDPVPPGDPIDPDTGEARYYPSPAGVPLDPSWARVEVWPAREQALLVGTEERNGFQIAKLQLHPLQWFPASELLRFTTSIDVTVNFEGGVPFQARKIYRQAMDLQDLAALVSNPETLPSSIESHPTIPQDLDAWYLIITDNFAWNAKDIAKGNALSGDMIAEMERLAEWKRQKGLQAEVVTISDIVNGRYGNFKKDAVDLQEVLRNFLKHAYSNFNTYWVLLAGDVAVIPARYVVMEHGADSSYFARETKAKPDEGKCFWDEAADTVRIHTSLNVNVDTPIITADTSHVFSRVDNPSAAQSGWAYAMNDNYSQISASKTEFIILRGALTHTKNKDFYGAADSNSIPTDLYYSSLVGPDYGLVGRHDWDKNENGIYGQFHGDDSVDGVDLQPDLALGRAPVQSGAEAKIFVDKVLAYEHHQGLDNTFSHTLLLGSSNWNRSPAVESGDAPQPAAKKYYNAPGSTTALLHFEGAPDGEDNLRLVAYNAAGDWWVVPYDRNANSQTLGWFFCTDSTYSVISEFPYSVNNVSLKIPIRTAYVKVRGPSDKLHPVKYFFDPVAMDRSAREKEELKDQFEGDFPEINLRKRLYVDLLDVPDYPAPDLFELSTDHMKAELNAGYNIVSLSGHGNPGGCCGVDVGYVKQLVNGARAGIVYANSCLTARFDDNDSVGEEFLKRLNGGSVAYVGNSRVGWVKAGGSFENSFWKSLAADRHLGRMHNSKALLTAGTNERWSNYTLNLLGDPEMEVWVDSPQRLDVDLPIEVAHGFPFEVKALGERLARVCVLGPKGFIQVHHTIDSDSTSFSTRSYEPGDTLTITVTKPGFLPYQAILRVTGSTVTPDFIRGDVNLDRKIDISDALSLLGALFLGERPVQCEDAADANDDGAVDISDARKILDFLFLGGSLPPGTTPGQPQQDPTADLLGCDAD